MAASLLALQRGAGNRAVVSALTKPRTGVTARTGAGPGTVQRLADGAPPGAATSGTAASSTVTPTATAPGGPTGNGAAATAPSGPLSFLGGVSTAAPSTLGAAVTTAAAAAPAAMDAGRAQLADQLPDQQAPTGLPPGEAADLPRAEPVQPQPVDRPSPAPGNLGPSGPPDPALADQWASTGTASITAVAGSATVPAPDVSGTVHPDAYPDRLTAPVLDGAPVITAGQAAAGGLPGGEAAAALDATMGPELAGALPTVLAPAGTVDAAHSVAVATVGAQTKAQIQAAESDTTGQQRAAVAAAQAGVTGLQTSFGAEKAGIVDAHRSALATESGQVKAEAARTIADADARAETESKAAGESGGGLWNKVKSVGAAALSAAKDVAGAVVSKVTTILASAREKVGGMLSRLASAVKQRVAAAAKAIADAARRVGAAIADTVRRARDAVTQLARSLAALASRLWQAAADRLRRIWQALKDAAAAAIRAALALVRKAAAALATIREILKLLGNKMLSFLVDIVQDPQGKIVAPMVAKAAPLAAGVPAKAGEVAKQNVPGQQTGPASPTIQRQAVPDAPQQEGFWSGVWRHLKAAGNHFLANWGTILAKVIIDVLLWFPMLVEELPKLWTEVKGVISGGGGVDRLDHFLGALRHIVNIVAGTLATVGVWALIIAWLGGPVAEGIVFAGYEALSIGVIAADLALAAVEMSKYAYSATRPGIDTDTRERYLGMFTGSGIAGAITIVMVALGALAARLAKAFKAKRLGGVVEVGEGKGGPKTGPEEKPPSGGTPVPDEGGPKMKTGAGKGVDPTEVSIRDGSVRMEQHPNYQAALDDLKAKGFEVVETTGDPHVEIRRVQNPEGAVLRTEKRVHVQKGMRYLDLEHEIGHVNQMMDKARFPDGPPPTDIVVEGPGGATKQAPNQTGVLTTWQDAIVEYHNRLKEIIWLDQRGTSPEIVKEHLNGLPDHAQRYRTKGLRGGKSPTQVDWAKEHFPDIGGLEDQVRSIKDRLAAGSTPSPAPGGGAGSGSGNAP